MQDKTQCDVFSVRLTTLDGANAIWTVLPICLSARLFVGPSVCPSRLWATRKRFKVSKEISHHTIGRCLRFLRAKFRSREFRNSLPTNGLKSSGVSCLLKIILIQFLNGVYAPGQPQECWWATYGPTKITNIQRQSWWDDIRGTLEVRDTV